MAHIRARVGRRCLAFMSLSRMALQDGAAGQRGWPPVYAVVAALRRVLSGASLPFRPHPYSNAQDLSARRRGISIITSRISHMATSATYKLLLLPGDGIGPEVMAEVEKVTAFLGASGVASFEIERGLVG